MGGFAVALDGRQTLGPAEAPHEPIPLWGAVQRAWDDQTQLENFNARRSGFMNELYKRHEAIAQAVGRNEIGSWDQVDPNEDLWKPGGLFDPHAVLGSYETKIDALRKRYPDKMASIPTLDQVLTDYQSKLNVTHSEALAAAEQHPLASITGSIGGTIADPTNLAGAEYLKPFTVGRPLVVRMLAQGAGWAGIQAAESPFKIEDSQHLGPAYTAEQAKGDIAGAAFGGAAFEAAGPLLKGIARRIAPNWFADPAARRAAEVLDQGERDAMAIGDQPGADYEKAVSSLDTLSPPPQPPPARDLGDLFTGESPAPPITEPPGARILGSDEYLGRPIYAGSFDPHAVEADPARFQYKAEGDAQGVTQRLRGVEAWDATASGKAIIYQDADGRLVVADGHQRRALAQRMVKKGWEARLDGYLFREADGWTPGQVRTIAALKNIREGSGTILDAAKIFRDSPGVMADRSLPVTGDFIAQARGLAKLSDEAFGAVVNKVIPERYGAIIGEAAGDQPQLHPGLVKLMKEAEPANADEARALVQEAKLDDWISREGEQTSMFGDLPPESTTIARAKVKAAILRALRQDVRVFGQLVRHADAIEAGGNALARDANEANAAVANAALEMLSRLSLRSGEVGDAMAAAAREVLDGKKPGVAAKGLIQRIKNALARGERIEGVRLTTIDPPAPAGDGELLKGFDEPTGPGVKEQIAAKPEEAALEGEDAPAGLFDDLPQAGPHEQALKRLAPCAPGGAG